MADNPFLDLDKQPVESVNPFLDLDKQEDDGKQFYDDTAVGEIGEGIVSGGIGILEGVAGLGAAAVDIVADTNYGDKVILWI